MTEHFTLLVRLGAPILEITTQSVDSVVHGLFDRQLILYSLQMKTLGITYSLQLHIAYNENTDKNLQFAATYSV